MPFLIRVPQVSDRRESGKIVRWLVLEGDRVRVGQPLVELEFGKATLELEAEASGIVASKFEAAGATVEVNAAIASIALDAESDVG